ncbi:MAG: DUF6017 domain-containing protein [Dysosmobacter sp.]|nr:DUF6017 domain-containing protein [Dysosmobacter sp.]
MAVYRVERTRDYTVMSNHHLKDTNLSLKAKGLLSLMLSLPDDWNFNMRGLSSICKEGLEAIGNALKELEKAGYMVRNQLRGANGRITDTEYIIYERPQEPAPADPDTASPYTPPPDTTLPYPGNPDVVEPDMADPSAENPALLNTKKSNTKKLNTQRPNIHSFPPPAPSTPPAAPAAPVEGMKEIFERREDIKAQIEYDLIADLCNQTQLDEFVEIMLEVALSRSPTMKIGRDAEYPTAFVQQRFEQLNSEHIRKVLDGIQENTTRVWNTRAYLLAALFNAPATTDNHYTMLVNHDMSNGG